jgi:hypothetical protein
MPRLDVGQWMLGRTINEEDAEANGTRDNVSNISDRVTLESRFETAKDPFLIRLQAAA